VRNQVLQEVKEKRNALLQTIKRRNDNWIGHILLTNYLLKQVTEEKIEESVYVTRRQGGRRKHLLGDLIWTRREIDYGMNEDALFIYLFIYLLFSKVRLY
jgi:hypothetical protein